MARIARVVAPGYPHHVTQRGNRRQRTFFTDADYRLYLNLLAQKCAGGSVEIWSYCLMPNHVHLVAVPKDGAALRLVIGEVHRKYTNYVNFREGWRGYLWQGRFSSYVMDDNYLLAAARYIELNPVRAGLVKKPEDYPWSSARAHLSGAKDALANFARIDELVSDWEEFLTARPSDIEAEALTKHSSTGRPLGGAVFIKGLEKELGRVLTYGKRGRPYRNK